MRTETPSGILAMKIRSREMAKLISAMLDLGDAEPESFVGLYVLVHEGDVILMNPEVVNSTFTRTLRLVETIQFVRLEDKA